jgi:exonuclease SbcC
MKTIELKKLKLTNFKGIKNFEIEFNTPISRIGGRNATGKTTLFDACTWLLFGKDSEDRKDFNIKTLDKNNKAIPKIDHEVEATLLVDGSKIILRRCYQEKWTKRRGSEETEMTGHETLFFWNDVPLQSGEYQQKVENILLESTFKLITNPLYFNQIEWQDRRSFLVHMAGEIETPEIFKDFIASLGDKSIEEYRRELAARKKKLRTELDMIPARIDEVKRSMPTILEWDMLRIELVELEQKADEIEARITDASKSVDGVLKENQARINRISELKQKVSDIELAGHRELNIAMNERQNKILKLKSALIDIDQQIKSRDSRIDENKEVILRMNQEVEALRANWTKLNSQSIVFDEGDFLCPFCRRSLDPDTIDAKKDEMIKNFNEKKQVDLSLISAEGKKMGARILALESELNSLVSVDLSVKREELTNQMADAENGKFEKSPFPEEYHRIQKEIEELESVKVDYAQPDNSLQLQRSGYLERISVLKNKLGTRDQILTAEVRLEELSRQEKSYAQQLADCEKDEFQMEKFIRAKVDLLEGRINAMFSGVQFRLFDIQINGGLVECCDTLIAGVPWADANNGAKINSGIGIINVMSNHIGVRAPIWIDNSEAVNEIQDTEAQRIELYVTTDAQLTVRTSRPEESKVLTTFTEQEKYGK